MRIPILCMSLVLSLSTCDTDEGDPAPLGTTGTVGNFVDWAPAGTLPVPTYEGSCRLLAGTEYTSPGNGLADDSLTLAEGTNGGVVLDLQVSSGSQQVLSITGISLRRGKKDESYRDAVPTTAALSSWGDGLEGSVRDGTLCFSDKITGGVDLHAQFSLIFEDAGGLYHTVGGTFDLPATAIVDGLVPQRALAVDLQ